MIDLTTLSADDILAIPEGSPELLFADAATLTRDFRILARAWHPDRCADPLAAAVFAHVANLHAAAQKAPLGSEPNRLDLRGTDGRLHGFPYRRSHAHELGQAYIGDETIVYTADSADGDLFGNAWRRTASFPFADAKMRAEAERYLPRTIEVVDAGATLALAVAKTPDLIRLRDLRDHLGGRVEPVHAAWILSSLYNVACYLGYARLMHGAIGLDSWFVSPTHHAGALLGDWWYATTVGEPLTAAPLRTVSAAPAAAVKARLATPAIDLALIATTGRELLGQDARGRIDAPGPMADWLAADQGDDPVRAYGIWHRVLIDSFGARRFVELPVTASDVYR